MSGMRETHVSGWEKLYKEGHSLSYPNDVFVRVTHRLLKPQERPKVLDYGFGSGENMVHLARRGFTVWGCEVSESALQTAKARLDAAGLKAELALLKDGKLPYPDAFFDAVIPWQVLNYNDWDSLGRAVAELDRVLRPGGVFLCAISAPGDYQDTHSEDLGDGLHRLTVPSQAGMVTVIPTREMLPRAFPGRPLKIGHFGHGWEDVEARHWIVSYEKPR